MNANQLYEIAQKEGNDYLDKWGFSEICRQHLPEVIEANNWDFEIDDIDENCKVEVKTIAYDCPDGRRTYNLRSVWFEKKPVMIIQNSGRDDDEYLSRFITDEKLFLQMIFYIKTLYHNKDGQNVRDLIDPNEDIKELTFFYGKDLVEKR